MHRRYRQWMHDWEYHLTTRDTNRVVRPFEWGQDWIKDFPTVNGRLPKADDPAALREFFFELNGEILRRSDEFYSYDVPTDFRLERLPIKTYQTGSDPDPRLDRKYEGKFGTFLRWTSPVRSGYPENDQANARWFPAQGRRAIVILPQWNADAISHNALGRIFNMLGVAALRLSMPYHDARKPAELARADYAVSSNIGRTIAADRQAIVDIRCAADWLEQQGYTELGVMGTSLGSCYAFIASAHDRRFKVNIYNHASTYFGDVVWTGQSTRHIREGIEKVLTQDELRQVLLCISPFVYFDHYERWPKRSLMIYTEYDQTFLPEFSRVIAAEFRRRRHNIDIKSLPCGHYTLGESPYKYMDGWHICRFVAGAFGQV